MWWHMGPFEFYGLGMIFQGVFWIIVILLVVKLFEKRNKPLGIHKNSALEILRERFAKGEIDEEEFLKKKELLEK